MNYNKYDYIDTHIIKLNALYYTSRTNTHITKLNELSNTHITKSSESEYI